MLKEQIENYIPFNNEEEADKQIILDFMKEYDDVLNRENLKGHITSSAWVLNKTHDKVIMCYHKIYNSWSWLGGHNDGEEDCLKVAMKEVQEEAGIHTIRPLSTDIFSLEILSVDGHYKRGKYVNTHLHLNITYLLEADEEETLSIKEDENSGVAWFYLDEAIEKSSELWFKEHIYSKLNVKVRQYIKEKRI